MVPKILEGEIFSEPSKYSKKEPGQFEKSQHVYLGEKEQERISEMRNNIIHGGENFGLEPKYAVKSRQEYTMDQVLVICNRGNSVFELVTYDMRRVCVTIKRYSVSEPPYIQIRLLEILTEHTL